MTPLSKQYVMHCRDATYSRKITLIIFHRIIAWKKTTRLNTIPIMFVMLRYCWLQIYSYFDQGCRKKCTRQSRKGIVGGFEGTVLQRNLKECYRKPQTYVYEYSRKATKVGLTASVVSNSVSYPIFPFRIVACTFLATTFSKQLYTCTLCIPFTLYGLKE